MDELTAAKKLIHKTYYDGLNWCGCGDPTGVMKLMRDVLESIRWSMEDGPDGFDQKHYEQFKDKVSQLLGPIGNALCLSYFYMLDAAGLTEHGSGLVNGGWLTDEGRQFLAALKLACEEDWDSEKYDQEDE